MPPEAVAIVVLVLVVLAGAFGAFLAVLWRLLGIVEYHAVSGDVYDQHALISEIMENIGIAEDAGNLGDDELDDKDRR